MYLVCVRFAGNWKYDLASVLESDGTRVVNPDKVTSVLTLGQFIKAVSSFLGPIIAGVASSFWGDWKLIFIVYSVTTLLSIIWLITTIPGKEEGEEQEASFASTLALCKDARIRMLFLGFCVLSGSMSV